MPNQKDPSSLEAVLKKWSEEVEEKVKKLFSKIKAYEKNYHKHVVNIPKIIF